MRDARIRAATIGDVSLLAGMGDRTAGQWGNVQRLSHRERELRLCGQLEAGWLADLFIIDDVTIGYVLYAMWDDQDGTDGRIVHIQEFFVDHEYRDRSLGTQLFQQWRAIRVAAGTPITVDLPALRAEDGFWKRLGFRVHGVTLRTERVSSGGCAGDASAGKDLHAAGSRMCYDRSEVIDQVRCQRLRGSLGEGHRDEGRAALAGGGRLNGLRVRITGPSGRSG